jgi:hypothetical protein
MWYRQPIHSTTVSAQVDEARPPARTTGLLGPDDQFDARASGGRTPSCESRMRYTPVRAAM